MTPANLDLRSGVGSRIVAYGGTRGAEGGPSPHSCGMYLYELITFGPVVSIAYHGSGERLRVGDEVAHRGRLWRVDRVEPRGGANATRLICLEADVPLERAS